MESNTAGRTNFDPPVGFDFLPLSVRAARPGEAAFQAN
ncbi:hypothetical protein FBY31_0245 [Arthrobacter sp. SLBN-100]|nr:hypothetical protein FBY31_0245 [Arthrobacter sp. SLBN-100]